MWEYAPAPDARQPVPLPGAARRALSVAHPDSANERAADAVADRVAGRASDGDFGGIAREVLGSGPGARLHADAPARSAARGLRAKAFTVGEDVFLASPPRPGVAEDRWVVAHELAHVAQARAGLVATGTLHRTPEDELVARASYPTAAQRGQVQDILNPQQQQAATTGVAVPAVTDPAGFTTAMRDRLDPVITQALGGAVALRDSPVALAPAALTALADVADPAVRSFYGTYLTAAVHTPASAVARASYRLRDHIHEVPSVETPATTAAARDWVASRMRQRGGDLLESFHVLPGRDDALFDSTRDAILAARLADLKTIILYYPGYEGGGEAYIQRRIVPRTVSDLGGSRPETAAETLRRGRWRTFGTTIHEMLHAVAHDRFTDAVSDLENSGIAVEGFAEYFTRPVYDDVRARAASDDAVRTSVEGVSEPFEPSLAPDRTGYDTYVAAVRDIKTALGESEENLRVAFFLGRVEYLGLGGWSEAEARRRADAGQPANSLGIGIVYDSSSVDLSLRYGRILVGRSGGLELRLGGVFGYLSAGDRLTVGAGGSIGYTGRDVFVSGGLDVVGRVPVAGEAPERRIRLDLVPGIEVGVRLGVVRIGAGGVLVVPVAGDALSDRTVRLGGRVGLSVDF